MKSRLALAAFAIVLGAHMLPAGADGIDLRREPVVQGDATAGKSKSAVCGACHGADGNSQLPEFPSLAGQQATYLYIQLREYKSGTRPSDIMRPLLEQLTDQDFKDLSAYYATLPPARSSSAGSGEADKGRALFTRGDPAKGVPPCQGCHGASANGPARPSAARSRPATPWHTYPALAGQQAAYVVAQLKAFKQGTRSPSTNARVMQAAVQSLDDESMLALAQYLSQLPAT